MLKYTQNFLHDERLVAKIVSKAQLAAGDQVLEIGPGKGIITDELARQVGKSGRVVAVELDSALAQALRGKFVDTRQIELVEANILDFSLAELGDGYSIFSNVPFNITSALLSHLFTPETGPCQAHLILQTDTLIGTNKGSYQTETLKSLLIKPLYAIGVVHRFSATDFRPKPSVSTALFSFEKRAVGLVNSAEYLLYQDFVAFTAKDRVGEGAWLKLFAKKRLATLSQRSGLVIGRGLKSQSFEAIVASFNQFKLLPKSKHSVVTGAMHRLREEQKRHESKNRAGGHHRSKSAGRKRRQR